MSRSVNQVFLVGNLGRDAETRFTPGGIAVTNFTLATTRRVKKQGTEEWEDVTDWHNVTLWRNERLAEFLKKGKQVHVQGRLQTRSWEKDGEKRYATDVVADEVILLGGAGGQERAADAPVSRPRTTSPATSTQPRTGGSQPFQASSGDDFAPGITYDDVPF